MNNVTRLTYGDKEILLLATAHVSEDSVRLVREIVEQEKPDSICIELDEGRYQSIQNPRKWEDTNIVDVIRQGRTGFLLANLALGSYQKRIAKQLGTNPGQEMIQGMHSAQETGAELVLADRSIQTTFQRIWRKLGFFEKCKLIVNIIFSFDDGEEISQEDFHEMLKEDMLESMLHDMRKQFPKIGQILISERDQHLAYKIKNASGKKVVAILGGAHVPGVKQEIFKEQNLDEITTVPPKSPVTKIIGWAIPIAIIALIAYGFFSGAETGLRQLLSWIVWNGSLAALFTALSFGHPLTILTALVVAPISSLNPMLACGWFAGLMEAHIRKPTVKDLSTVSDDILHIKGFFRNRFLRILLIVIMANLGSTIGTFVAGIDIISNLF